MEIRFLSVLDYVSGKIRVSEFICEFIWTDLVTDTG